MKDANAYPRKHFFLEMFTRDISLEDCVLDLIDNSIDGLIKSRDLDITASLLTANTQPLGTKTPCPRIDVKYSDKEFEITDTCGGISLKDAMQDVFNFGHAAGDTGGALGVYGIGLKRAIFKIGNVFEMISRTTESGFSVNLDIPKWSAKDDDLTDWTIPLKPVGPADSAAKAGTTIKITGLRPEVCMRVNDGVFAQKLHSTISQTYSLFLKRHVEITLNGKTIEPFQIPLATSADARPAHAEFQDGVVLVKLFASLAARDASGEWPGDKAGWYALCNGRMIVAADQTDLTGWGVLGTPQFHVGKYRGFVGVAFFQSANALALPWTTTKRGLNRESAIYQKARNQMRGVATPILRFLDGMYKPDAPENAVGKTIADGLKPVGLAELAGRTPAAFSVVLPRARKARNTVSVQYQVERSDVERIRKHLRKPGLAAHKVGKLTFEHYLKTECPR